MTSSKTSASCTCANFPFYHFYEFTRYEYLHERIQWGVQPHHNHIKFLIYLQQQFQKVCNVQNQVQQKECSNEGIA